MNPSPSELKDLSLACTKLWELDDNRLTPNEDYEINLQQGKSPYQTGDMAPDNLFTFVDPKALQKKTYKLFIDLLDNYERETGVAETVTREELRENELFINAICETRVMKYAHAWLQGNRKFTGDLAAFKRKLHEIWFGLYRREVANDSSGFEHVFIGEVKDHQVTGFHNWIQMYMEEKAGRLDYLGYIKPKQRGRSVMEPHEYEQLITIQFAWEKEVKPVSTSLIGVSPEFEMALYTMCFLNGVEQNEVMLGPYKCIIKCFSIGRGDRAKIGSSFPEACPLSEEQAASKIQAIFRGKSTRAKVPPPSASSGNSNNAAWRPAGQPGAPAWGAASNQQTNDIPAQQPRPAGNPWGTAAPAPAQQPARPAGNPWGTAAPAPAQQPARPAGNAWGTQPQPAAERPRPAGNPWGTQSLQNALPKSNQENH